METIKDNEEFFGKYISIWKPEYQNAYVITGMIQGKECVAENRVGRVVQVRLEAGDFGSDCVLLRHRNDDLIPHENQSFWLIPEKFKAHLDECFEGVYADDANEEFYTIQGKDREKGFIIPSKIKKGQSTQMRDIKEAIGLKLEELNSK